jgi:hypothetical protein
MFDEVPEWSRRHALRRPVARRVCRMLLHDLRDSIADNRAESRRRRLSSLRRWQWRLLRSWVVRAVAGNSVVLMQAQRRRFSARLALRADLALRKRARGEVHLVRCCEAIATVERMRFLRRWDGERRGANGRSVDDAPSSRTGTWQPGLLDESHGVGFFEASGGGADAIRWSEPAAYVELPLVPGRHVITLNWLFRPPVDGEPSLRFYVDERPLASDNVAIRDDRVELRVDVPESSSPVRLGWVCAAHRVDGDYRRLGLPVVSVAWARDDTEGLDVVEPTAGVTVPMAAGAQFT